MKSFLVTLLVVALLAGSAVWVFLSRRAAGGGEPPLFTKVTRGPYEHIVLDQGEIQSSNNVDVHCQVRNRTGGDSPSTTILDVIEEGTTVKKGDWLVSFDSSALENELTQQTILAKTSETLVIQAKAAYDTAVIALKEYLEGTYEQERKTNENLIFVAEENLKKAELSYDSIKRSVARGLMSQLQLQGEQFRVDAARKDLELAKQTLNVLDNYTKEKMMTQLSSDVKATKIQWENEKARYDEELKKLKEIEVQITACTVYAPQAGQVVYANVYSSRSSNEFVVEKGAAVRERQAIIRLPDPKNMEVDAKITETQINLIGEGLPVLIRVEALGDELLDGLVTKVNKYAEPGNWWSSTGKEYKTIIKILNPPTQIRAGLTAEVRIHVEQRDDALQLPVQAILEREGQTFCLVRNGDRYQTRHVVISSTNDKVVALDESQTQLSEEDQVVLNPRQHVAKFDFSEFPLLEPNERIAARPGARNAISISESAAEPAPSKRTGMRGDGDSTASQEVTLPAQKTATPPSSLTSAEQSAT